MSASRTWCRWIAPADAALLAGVMDGLASWLDYGDPSAHDDLARFLWGHDGPGPFDDRSLVGFDSLAAVGDLASVWRHRFEHLATPHHRRGAVR